MNSVRIFYCLLCIYCYNIVKASPVNKNSAMIVKRVNKQVNTIMRNYELPKILKNITITYNVDLAENNKTRVKRDTTGAGKFVEAAKIPQLKLFRLFLQMFKNLWDDTYVGGVHPLHPNVPKVVVKLYREKIVEYFVPDVGKESHVS